MRRIRPIVLTFFALSTVAADPAPSAPAAPSLAAVANRVVAQAAAVKEGELVVISGDIADMDVLTEISLETAKLGASPLLLVSREADARRFLDEVPAKYDAVTPGWAKAMAADEHVLIAVGDTQDAARFKDWPADRLAARGAAFQPVYDELLSRKVRYVWLGNNLYPTDGVARSLGVPRAELEALFWRAVDVDYTALAATAEKVGAVLRAGKEIRITHKNGTDLKMRIEARPVTVSDGVISADDLAKGGSQLITYLPAGEVIVLGVPGTAEGKIVIDRAPVFGSDVIGWTLTVKAGRIVGMTAASGLELIKPLYDAAPACKEVVGWVDLGVNPNIPSTTSSGQPTLAWMVSGMTAVGWGADILFGGTESCPYGSAAMVPGSTVKVDKRVLVDKGTLVLPES